MEPPTLPKEINFFSELPSYMVGSKKYEWRTNPSTGAGTYTHNQSVKATIPSLDRSLLNTQTMYLNGQVTFNNDTDGVGASVGFLGGSFWSLFSRFESRSDGTQIDTIQYPDRLFNFITSMTMSESERNAMANLYGFDSWYYKNSTIVATATPATYVQNQTYPITSARSCDPNNLGVRIPATADDGCPAGSLTYNFSIPIFGAFNMMKYFPMWSGANVEFEFTVNTALNSIIPVGNVNASTKFSYTLSNLELSAEVLELDTTAYNGLMMAMGGRPIELLTSSYTYGSGAIPAGSTQSDIQFQQQYRSLKQIYFYFNTPDSTAVTASLDYPYGGVNPQLLNYQFVTNGENFPQKPVRAYNQAEVLAQNMKSWGSLYSSTNSGQLTRRNFGKAESVSYVAGSNFTAFTQRGAGMANATEINIVTTANKYYLALDFEKLNGRSDLIYNGVATTSNNTIFRFTNAVAPTIAYTINFWAHFDVKLTIDTVNKLITLAR